MGSVRHPSSQISVNKPRILHSSVIGRIGEMEREGVCYPYLDQTSSLHLSSASLPLRLSREPLPISSAAPTTPGWETDASETVNYKAPCRQIRKRMAWPLRVPCTPSNLQSTSPPGRDSSRYGYHDFFFTRSPGAHSRPLAIPCAAPPGPNKCLPFSLVHMW